jgi:acyl carrier protein
MQLSKENILHIIFGAVDEVNQALAEEKRLEKSPSTLLAGDNGRLDSLGMIHFIVEVEGRVQKDFNWALDLIEALDSPEQPMSSIGRLVEYIEMQVSEE